MTRLAVSTMALLAVLGATPAGLAQSSDSQQQVVPQPQESQAQPSAPAGAAQQEVQGAQKTDAEVPEGLIVLQDENTFLTSNLMGATVYNADNEAVGDVNDVIMSREGMIEGMVLGVGGFLGIGEKSVAVKMDQIEMRDTETGIKLVLNATREQLAEAPEFKPKVEPVEGATQGLMAPGESEPAEGTAVPPQQQ